MKTRAAELMAATRKVLRRFAAHFNPLRSEVTVEEMVKEIEAERREVEQRWEKRLK